MHEIPEWILNKIEFDAGRKLQQKAIVEVFFKKEKPFLTRREVQTNLRGDFARGTVIDRLKELAEIGVLNASPQKGGDIYWINYEESDWPVPPDVVVGPASEEMTVSEFFEQSSVTISGFGIGLILVSTLAIWIGGIFAGAHVIDSNISNGIVVIGLLGIFIGWIILGYGIFRYFRGS